LKLNSASASGPVSVSLASNNPAITLPATVVIPTNAARTQFTANVASVSTAQTVILTARMPGSASITYPIQLHPYVSVSGSFAYAGSPLVSTLAPANPSTPMSNKFFGMTIYYLAPNSLYPAPNMTTFPSFPVSTLRFWDSVYWSMSTAKGAGPGELATKLETKKAQKQQTEPSSLCPLPYPSI
jgi:hypothetical protein